MASYVERVAHNLKGLSFVSTGVCFGCDECRDACDDYKVRERYDDEKGREFYTFKARKGEYYDTEELAEAASRAAFEEDCASQDVLDEGSFSWDGCGICGSSLGGTFYAWHGIVSEGSDKGAMRHFDDACVDCVCYLANGDIPGEEA